MLGLAFAVLNVCNPSRDIAADIDVDAVLDCPICKSLDQFDFWWKYQCCLGYVLSTECEIC